QLIVVTLREKIRELESSQQFFQAPDAPTLLAEAIRELAALQTEEAALRVELDRTAAALEQKRQSLVDTIDSASQVEARLVNERSALITLRRETERRKEQLDEMSSAGTRTVIEFSNPTGTVQEPVIINVTADGFEFLPSGIRIAEREMRGFPLQDNPLVSGIRAATTARSSTGIAAYQPYVLLLVRPDGCIPFYGAQRVLMENRIHFGYELLQDQRVVDAGIPAEGEQDAVRQAVLDALLRRDRLYARLNAGPQDDELTSGSGRKYVIGRDGKVRTAGPDRSESAAGDRVYAGGFAPPPNSRHRPPGGYQTLNDGPPAIAPAGPVGIGRSTGTGEQRMVPFAGSGADAVEARSVDAAMVRESLVAADPAANYLNGHVESAGSNSANESFSSTTQSQQPFRSGSQSLPFLSLEATPERQGGTIKSDVMVATNGSDRAGTAGGIPGQENPRGVASTGQFSGTESGKTDLSRIDPDLLRQLQAPRHADQSISAPVGISVFVDAHHLTVEQQQTIDVQELSGEAVLQQLLTAIRDEVDAAALSTREPLIPIVRFIVSPGGERLHLMLSQRLNQLRIYHASMVSIDPHIAFTDVGTAALTDDSSDAVVGERTREFVE
ncbi:MAG: hypothetical protein KDA85_15700, partial [Planctomycetaceae bacterium]|nr:hypothetical protein [Planctomycetaceae bacterium]